MHTALNAWYLAAALIALIAGSVRALPVATVLQAEYANGLSGVVLLPPADQEPRNAIKDCSTGDWIRFDSVNFMDGCYNSFTAWTWSAGSGSVQVRLDSPTGTVAATAAQTVWNDRSANRPSTPVTTALARATGLHAVYLTFVGGNNVCDVDRIRFSGDMVAQPGDAVTFYVATDGNDASNGLTIQTPFRTIRKAASVMKPGATCRIRQGVYRETVIPLYTGLSGAPLTFEPYNGEKVFISGADSVKGWTQHSGSIYKAPVNWTMGEYNNQVIVDGKMAWMARSPNVEEGSPVGPYWAFWRVVPRNQLQGAFDPIMFPSRLLFSGDNSATSSYTSSANRDNVNLPQALQGKAANAFAGGLHVVHNDWWGNIGTITSSQCVNSGTIRLTCQKTGGMRACIENGGYISHVFSLLDSPNEWFLQGGVLYLWTPDGGSPSNHLVEMKRRTLGFDLTGKQHVTLKGLHFIATSLTLADAESCIVDDCHFKYTSHFETFEWYEQVANYWKTPLDPSSGYKGIFLSGSNNAFKNSSVAVTAGTGVWLYGDHNTVTNCRIHDINYTHTYDAGIGFGKRDIYDDRECMGHQVSRNTIYNCGRSAVNFDKCGNTEQNDPIRISYNDISRCMLLSSDGGAIYTFGNNGSRTEIDHNWLHSSGGYMVVNIYMDYGGYMWRIHHNVFWKGETIDRSTQTAHFVPNLTTIESVQLYNNTMIDAHPAHDWDRWAIEASKNVLVVAEGGDTTSWKFSDAVRRDYSLRAGSPAIDAGATVPGVSLSYSGAAPDLGAYEFGQTPWTAGANWQEEPWEYPPPVASVNHWTMGSRLPMRQPIVRMAHSRLSVYGLDRKPCAIRVFDAKGALLTAVSVVDKENVSVGVLAIASRVCFVRMQIDGRTFVLKVSSL